MNRYTQESKSYREGVDRMVDRAALETLTDRNVEETVRRRRGSGVSEMDLVRFRCSKADPSRPSALTGSARW
jgi:hypothetical protein